MSSLWPPLVRHEAGGQSSTCWCRLRRGLIAPAALKLRAASAEARDRTEPACQAERKSLSQHWLITAERSSQISFTNHLWTTGVSLADAVCFSAGRTSIFRNALFRKMSTVFNCRWLHWWLAYKLTRLCCRTPVKGPVLLFTWAPPSPRCTA